MTSGSGSGGRLLASYPTDVRNGGGIRVDKQGLATRIAIDLRDTQQLDTAPAGGLVPVQDPVTGLVQALDFNKLPTSNPADGTVTNVKAAPMPTLTIKGNTTGVVAQPQDVPLSALAGAGNPVGDAIGSKAPNTVTAPDSGITKTVYLNLIDVIHASQYCEGDNATDNGPAIQKMVNRANGSSRGARMVFKDQLYRTSMTHTFGSRVFLEGPGGNAGWVLQTTSNIDTFRYVLDEAVKVEGMWLLQNNYNQTAGALLTITGGATINFRSLVTDCRFQNGYVQLKTENTGILGITDSHFYDYDIGLVLDNKFNGDNGDYSISGCNFAANVGAGRAGIAQYSGGGTRIVNTKIVGGEVGYLLQLQDIGGIPVNATSIVMIDASSIEGQTKANVELTHSPSVVGTPRISMFDINAGELMCQGGARNVWIHGGFKFIDSVYVRPAVMQTPPGAIGCDVDWCDGYHFAPGVITGGYLGNQQIQPIGIVEKIGPNVKRNTRGKYVMTTPVHQARTINQSAYCHGNDEITVIRADGSTTASLDFITDVGMLDSDFSACVLEIVSEGLLQGVGTAVAKSTAVITRGSGGGSLNVAMTNQVSVGGMTHSSQLFTGADLGKVRIFAAFTSSQTGVSPNRIGHTVKATGRFCRLLPNQAQG